MRNGLEKEHGRRMSLLDLLWLFLILSSLQPLVQTRILKAQRAHALRALEKRDHAKAITLIHRREGFSFLGIPFGSFLDIEDSEDLIRAIETTAPDKPISLVLHTPGGLVLAAEQIAAALAAHPYQVTVYVPHYAMSGGTLVALASDRIVMAPSAVLGPIDPQIGDMPAASILDAVSRKHPNRVDDKTLVWADVGRKARQQVEAFVERLLARHLPADRAHEVAQTLTEGRWTHDFPIDVDHAQKLGFPVSTDLPVEVRDLMTFYPQSRVREPSVEYVSSPSTTT
jgi:ClpP class serine protease